MRILINGTGIAGTALAFWLSRLGHELTLVERAPRLREGGFVVNLWGSGYDSVEKMGLLPRLLALQHLGSELRMVDARGRTRGGYPAEVLLKLAKGRLASLSRSDIAATLYAALDDRVETVFGDSVSAIHQDGARVRLEFENSAAREVDLVIGADGLHSRVRELAFGPQSQFEYALGGHVASWEVRGYRPREEGAYIAYSAPGRYIARCPLHEDRMLFFVLVRNEHLGGAVPQSHDPRVATLHRALAGQGWECDAILATLAQTETVYFDSISQIRMDRWVDGRVALIGDAASCPSLIAGEGAGLALTQAYVLAGELHRHAGDPSIGLTQYQARLQSLIAHKQKLAEGFVASFVPKSRLGVRLRDYATLLMRLPLFPELLMGRYFKKGMALPEYGI
jgi:2-polyprenyl-6-methoxyphenol hydroxylase-like FAD-dependent oxidoreductase